MSESDQEAFLSAFEVVLKPLLRIGHHYGIPGHRLRDAFSQATVEFFAEEVQEKEERPVSATRVAMYAGLNTGEVIGRLTERVSASRSFARRAQLLSSVLNAWHVEPGYAAVYDLAREIPIDAEPGKPSFLSLCAKVDPDANPEDLLEELLASRCVERLDGGFIRPLTRTYVVPPGDATRLDRMGKVMVNLGESFARFITREEGRFSQFTERTLVADFGLSQNGIKIFDAEVRERGTKLLTDLDSWLALQGDRVSSEAGPRYGCGIYVFEDVASVGRKSIELDEDASANGEPPIDLSERIEIDVIAPPPGITRG